MPAIFDLTEAGIRVSLFIEPEIAAVDEACRLGVPAVELQTGTYSEVAATGEPDRIERELARLRSAAAHGARRGLEIHAGHGLTLDNVGPVAAIPEVVELNIGHFLIGEALFAGLEEAVRAMREAMDVAREQACKSPRE